MTDIMDVVKKYPIGSTVFLSCDRKNDNPKEVQGYKQIGEGIYIIFSDGHIACTERIANVM